MLQVTGSAWVRKKPHATLSTAISSRMATDTDFPPLGSAQGTVRASQQKHTTAVQSVLPPISPELMAISTESAQNRHVSSSPASPLSVSASPASPRSVPVLSAHSLVEASVSRRITRSVELFVPNLPNWVSASDVAKFLKARCAPAATELADEDATLATCVVSSQMASEDSAQNEAYEPDMDDEEESAAAEMYPILSIVLRRHGPEFAAPSSAFVRVVPDAAELLCRRLFTFEGHIIHITESRRQAARTMPKGVTPPSQGPAAELPDAPEEPKWRAHHLEVDDSVSASPRF